SCTENAECANGGGVCAQFQGQAGGVCTQVCGNGVACPGDSICVQFQDQTGATYPLCVNPDFENAGICHNGYTCSGTNEGGCPSTGVSCANQGAMCGPDTEFCLTTSPDDMTGVCSCSCQTDSDCGAGNSCVPLTGGSFGCVQG